MLALLVLGIALDLLTIQQLATRQLRTLPYKTAAYLRSRVICNERSFVGPRCAWTAVHETMVDHVNKKYFGINPQAGWNCDVFLIEGVPAASLLYETSENTNVTIAREFVLNKAVFLMFDAGPCMRKLLYKRHKKLDTRLCKNKTDILLT